MFIFFLIFIITVPSFAFLDFVGEQAKKAVEVTAYVDAASELASEVSEDKDLENEAKDLKRRSDAIRSESANLGYLNRNVQNITKGPDWSSKRLETNIRSTTDYIRRLKSLLVRAVALGTDGTIALNTTETNVALNEIQKNQQALIMQNADFRLRELEREQEDFKQWADFSKQQRKVRSKEVRSGKL